MNDSAVNDLVMVPPGITSVTDEYWMRQALALAAAAEQQGEVPVGAVLVRHEELLGEGYNCPISSRDPTAHAEIVALRQAALHLDNYRLADTTLYVTIEPCTMCVGALIHARVARVVFGAFEPRAGAVCSQHQLLDHPAYNHQLRYSSGVLQDECAAVLRTFFRRKRQGQ